MELSEKEIEDFIFYDLSKNNGLLLQEKGLELKWFEFDKPKCLWNRQLNIEPYGICDIVGFYRIKGHIMVELIELKKTPIDANHFEQISRYKKGLEVYLKNTFRLGAWFNINSTLIGTGYVGLYIQNYIDISVASMNYNLSGASFEMSSPYAGWYMIEGKNKSFRDGRL